MESRKASQVLKQRWERERDASFAGILLTAMALTREAEATDFLIQLIETQSPSSEAADRALTSAGLSAEQRSRFRKNFGDNGSENDATR